MKNKNDILNNKIYIGSAYITNFFVTNSGFRNGITFDFVYL